MDLPTPSAQQNMLWKLPAELRELVYINAFTCSEEHAYCLWKDGIFLTLVDGRIYKPASHKSHNLGQSTKCGACALGLLRTSKAIYDEALPVFHHAVELRLHVDGRYRSPWEGVELGAVGEMGVLRNARVWEITVRLSRFEDADRLVAQLNSLREIVEGNRAVEWRSISVQISRYLEDPELGDGILRAVRTMTGIESIDEIKDPWREAQFTRSDHSWGATSDVTPASRFLQPHHLPLSLRNSASLHDNFMATSLRDTLLAGIAKERVTDKTPPTAGDELDADRCVPLHNVLTLYGWVSSGKKISELRKRTWWSTHGTPELEKILRPKLRRYLSKIFEVPNYNFFYHVSGLASPKHMLQLADVLEDDDHVEKPEDKYRFVILYKTSEHLVSQPAGIVFDQQTSKAILMPTYHHLFDLKGADLPWQNLETILSAYVDMIQSEKALAIHDEAIVEDATAQHAGKGGDLERNKTFARYSTRPWILQPYTLDDLHECLDTWTKLVKTIEQKAGIKRSEEVAPEDEAPLASRTALNIAEIPRGFAYEILSHARQSEVWFVAPGLRLPKVEEFLQQPFKDILKQYPEETRGMKVPFLFLRCPGTVSAKEAKFRYPFSTLESVPCGLYLDAFPNAQNPFEDACRLVLPIRLSDKRRYARTSDGRLLFRSHSDLYQTGINPFVMRHGPKLVAVLDNWRRQVETGHWGVNERGVEGGIGVWRQAETREHWWRYQSDSHLFI
ncbi:unnamed protein product [Zymoseptoria tritici ST99CH_3D7]|uniref:Uncharacterized protein n=2 Tax=Zymoseptoria tritici TaxID=1047171 RepID=A0A1X7S471_ZYMT9|nr:unnamed protein product [Zymoseptoria tritici ST99CH_3D7]